MSDKSYLARRPRSALRKPQSFASLVFQAVLFVMTAIVIENSRKLCYKPCRGHLLLST